jgi:hypothetical protein
MAVRRLSPGIYEVDGKRVSAINEAEAIKKAGGGKKKASTPAGTKPIATKPTGAAVETGADIAPGASKTVQGALTSEADVGNYEANTNIKLNNPNVTNPFGSQKVTRNADGSVSLDQTLSEEQQGILDRGENLTKTGQELAAGNLAGYQKFGMGQDAVADRARMEEAVYGRLTRDFDQRQKQDAGDAEQQLYNKGIAFSADPNSRYQQELRAVSQRYDDARGNARAQAVELGGSEYQRNADIGLASHQQGMADTTTLQQQGTGLQVPNFQAYQGSSIDMKSPTEVDLAYKQLANEKKQTQAQIDASRRRGGSGGGAATTPTSVFNTTPPPGYGG